jgi:hypothetical protein
MVWAKSYLVASMTLIMRMGMSGIITRKLSTYARKSTKEFSRKENLPLACNYEVDLLDERTNQRTDLTGTC